MENFLNQSSKKEVLKEPSKDEKNILALYEIFYPNEEISGNFVDVCHKIAVALNEIPDHVEMSEKIKGLIKDAIYYIVHNLRDSKEINSPADQKKKEVVWELEILAKEYFDTLKNHPSDNVSMDQIEIAWRIERGQGY